MPDPLAQVTGAARMRKPSGSVAGSRSRSLSIAARNSGVTRSSASIQKIQSPVVCASAIRACPCSRETGDLRPCSSSDARSRLCGPRIGINDDDLVRPGHGFAHGGDVLFFVADDDGGGDFHWRRPFPLPFNTALSACPVYDFLFLQPLPASLRRRSFRRLRRLRARGRSPSRPT